MITLSSIFAFFTGGLGRVLWGEAVSFFTKRQDHKQELERIELQERIDASKHARMQEAIRTQHSLNVEVIRVQSDEAQEVIGTEAWAKLVAGTTTAAKPVGIKWVDGWIGATTALNASIRPLMAVWAVVMVTLSEFTVIAMSVIAVDLCFAVLGIYLADRTLGKRGK